MRYYLQSAKHGFIVGNSVLWWAKNSSGYTTNIDKAGVYSEEEAKEIYLGGWGGVIAWPKEYIDSIISRCVDSQHMNCDRGVTWKDELKKAKKEMSNKS